MLFLSYVTPHHTTISSHIITYHRLSQIVIVHPRNSLFFFIPNVRYRRTSISLQGAKGLAILNVTKIFIKLLSSPLQKKHKKNSVPQRATFGTGLEQLCVGSFNGFYIGFYAAKSNFRPLGTHQFLGVNRDTVSSSVLKDS